MKLRGAWVLSCMAALLAGYVALHRLSGDARAAATSDPRYASNGDLLRPEDFAGWIFVGSNLGLGYAKEVAANTLRERSRQDLGEYHNVYIRPEAYAAYVQNGTFPDKTVLVMDKYAPMTKEPKGVVEEGSFNGPRIGMEVAVKNKSRPDGKSTDWAYYDFTDPAGGGKLLAEAKAFPDSDCYSCHKAHAGDDNVWVQFYPTLRRVKQPN